MVSMREREDLEYTDSVEWIIQRKEILSGLIDSLEWFKLSSGTESDSMRERERGPLRWVFDYSLSLGI